MSAASKLTDEQRRALQFLERSPAGQTEAILMAHGFELAMLATLCSTGLATAETHETMAGRQLMKVFWMQITEEGRQAIN
jgi:hypothetical protein